MSGAQPELPMKDVTPPKKNATPPITEGMVRKGGRNQGPSQVKERPAAPQPMNAPPASPPAKPKTKKSTAVAVHDPSALPAQTNLATMLIEVARDKEVDAAKAKAMFDLYKDVQAHDAKTAFTRAFIAVQKKLPMIDKDGRIEHVDTKGDGKSRQKSLYSTYPNLMKVVKPLLDQFGFGLGSWIEPGEGGKIDVVTQLDHEQGHSRMSRFPLAAETSGSKNNIQGWGSSESYGMRYNAIALLNIVSRAPSDRDLDGNQNRESLKAAKGGGFVDVEERPMISKAQLAEIKIAMDDARVSETNFCKHYGIEKVGDLPADLFDAAKKELADHKAKYQKGPARG